MLTQNAVFQEDASDVGYEDGNNDDDDNDDDDSSAHNFDDVDDDHDHVHSDGLSSESMIHHQAPQIVKKDLILVLFSAPLFNGFPYFVIRPNQSILHIYLCCRFISFVSLVLPKGHCLMLSLK